MKNNDKNTKLFGRASAWFKGTTFEYAVAIAELASKYAEQDGWHSCDFLFKIKDGKLLLFQDFRIRKAPKKLLKGLLE